MTEPAKGLTKEERKELEEAHRQLEANIRAQEHKLHSKLPRVPEAPAPINWEERRARYEELLEKEFGSVRAGRRAMRQEGRKAKKRHKADVRSLKEIMDKNEDLLPKDESTNLDKE